MITLPTPIIDSHTHVFPNLLKEDLTRNVPGGLFEGLHEIRKFARRWWSPVSRSIHSSQTVMRHLPEEARKKLDEITTVAPLMGFLLESTAGDLIEAMDQNGVSQSWVIAHPPLISNEFVLELHRRNSRLRPVVNIPRTTRKPVSQLKAYVEQGACALKLHPASDGLAVENTHYRKLLKAASDLGIPVIIHTGCIHSHLVYKDPELGRAPIFAPWFKEFKDLNFILAHMNFHEPHAAFDLAEEHLNLYLETSWQPSEIIGEAVRRIGSDRILFGTDWPIVGSNIGVGLKRIQDCLNSGSLQEKDASLILGQNALKLLGKGKKEPSHVS